MDSSGTENEQSGYATRYIGSPKTNKAHIPEQGFASEQSKISFKDREQDQDQPPNG